MKADLLWLFAVTLLILVSQVVFLRSEIKGEAEQFAQDFQRNHFHELTSSDISALTVRLGSLASSDPISSLEIRFKGTPYFVLQKDQKWRERLFTEALQMRSGDGTVDIQVVFRASQQKLLSSIFYFSLQSFLLGALFLTALTWDRKRYRERERFQDLMIRVVHDMKPSLAALNVAASGDLPQDDRRKLIQVAVNGLSQVSGNLLGAWRSGSTGEWYRIEGEAILDSGQLEISQWIDECQSNFPARGVALEVLEPWVIPRLAVEEVPRGLIRRTLGNLAANSIDAGSRSLRISGKVSREHFFMTLEDDGSGIPETILHLLGRKPVTAGKKDGNGLGIFSAFEVFEKMGGIIDFSRVEPRGTRVILGFPVRKNFSV